MSNYNIKRKPTIKELTDVVLQLNDRLQYLYSVVGEVEKAISLYIEMKGDKEKFLKHVDKVVEEWKAKGNDSKENGKADKPNLQGDTDGESSRPKRVRKKKR